MLAASGSPIAVSAAFASSAGGSFVSRFSPFAVSLPSAESWPSASSSSSAASLSSAAIAGPEAPSGSSSARPPADQTAARANNTTAKKPVQVHRRMITRPPKTASGRRKARAHRPRRAEHFRRHSIPRQSSLPSLPRMPTSIYRCAGQRIFGAHTIPPPRHARRGSPHAVPSTKTAGLLESRSPFH